MWSEEARRDPYPLYRHMRDEAPVAFIESMNWYAVSRHDDVERVLRAPAQFSSSIMRGADRALLGADPPAHTAARSAVAGAFDSVRSRGLEDRIANTARMLIADFVARGGGDFVSAVAVELPVRIIAFLLGVGDERLPEFKAWSEAVILGASRMVPPERQGEVAAKAAAFDGCFRELIERRRVEPGPDLVSALVQSPLLGEPEVRSLAKLLLIAGNETTTNLMGNALLALFATPGLEMQLRAEPRACAAWIDETLRFDAPVQVVLRRCTAEVTMHGVRVPEGAVVAALIGSANRDERRHRDADAFHLGRAASHLAFGSGPHFCLGASLARTEAIVTLSALLTATREMTPADPPHAVPRIDARQLRGPRRLMIEAAS